MNSNESEPRRAHVVAARESSRRNLERQKNAGIDMVKFRFGGMAAGHCSFSEKMDGKKIPIDRAEPLPAASCGHPDQCGCPWQAWLNLMDEIGID